MSTLDWIVLVVALVGVIGYGLYKSKSEKTLDGYFKSSNSMGWLLILLSIMGTQASAVTFLSAPGQAYTDGMRFVQYYFGLPLAMVVLCVTFIPIYHKLKVFTAYEFLEQRFDLRTRSLASVLFLVSRALSTGISIYAPAIVLSSIFGWNIYFTNIVMGGFLIIYTVTGGSKAVAYTQMQQLIVVFIGMFLAGFLVVKMLPTGIGFSDALHVAGKMGKLNVIETKIDVTDSSWWKDKYNIWSGVIGGFFLALSYFGTDQSQVQRYLSGKSLKQSQMGLIMNGILKVPMQFFILLVGVMVFVFYQFNSSPLHFNPSAVNAVENSIYAEAYSALATEKQGLDEQLIEAQISYGKAVNEAEKQEYAALVSELNQAEQGLRDQAVALIKKADPNAETNDKDYVFIHFILNNLPRPHPDGAARQPVSGL